MKVSFAQFKIDNHWVVLDADQVQILDNKSNVLATAKNRWSSQGSEKQVVTGRFLKPRVADAVKAIKRFEIQGEAGLKRLGAGK